MLKKYNHKYESFEKRYFKTLPVEAFSKELETLNSGGGFGRRSQINKIEKLDKKELKEDSTSLCSDPDDFMSENES
jgi:hypothetical protein